MQIKVGDKLKCIFNQALPGNDYAPKLVLGEEYICKAILSESFGDEDMCYHIDVGLPLTLNWVKSYATGKELPSTTHWCHPNRFITLK